VLGCRAFLRLNRNFKKDIRRIRTRALSRCLWINLLTFKVGASSTSEWILTPIQSALTCNVASTALQTLRSSSRLKLCKFINNQTQSIWQPTAPKACPKWNIILTTPGKSFQCYNKTKLTRWSAITRGRPNIFSSLVGIGRARSWSRARNRSWRLTIIHSKIIRLIVLIITPSPAHSCRASIFARGRSLTLQEPIEWRHGSKLRGDKC
jgi:hypothetical protein